MSGLGPGDMGEVERTAALFVQRRDVGPPGGSGPGSPDKNITCVCACVSVRCWDGWRVCVCTNVRYVIMHLEIKCRP